MLVAFQAVIQLPYNSGPSTHSLSVPLDVNDILLEVLHRPTFQQDPPPPLRPANMPSERDPLLPQADPSKSDHPKHPGGVGPMEISRSMRYGILAGIWTASFLSVCNNSATHLMKICSKFHLVPCATVLEQYVQSLHWSLNLVLTAKPITRVVATLVATCEHVPHILSERYLRAPA